MKKNIGHHILVATIALCVGLMLGIFIGQGRDGNSISLVPSDLVLIDGLSHNYAYHDEVVGRININTASANELTNIPGIGEVTAQRIVDYRKTIGKFNSVNDLLNVKGIGENLLEKIRPYITVGG